MALPHREILKRLYRPLPPIPTSERPELPDLEGIAAVLFDVYGTLFVSGSGDLDVSAATGGALAFAAALEAVGLPLSGPAETGVQRLLEHIARFHAEARQRGVEYPEVDIIAVWQQTLADLLDQGVLPRQQAINEALLQRIALHYEARVNPVWPMPGIAESLRHLRSRRMALGIISNAQFYTRELFPALLGHGAEAWGFDPALQYYSYQHGVAKPGLALYRMARDTLLARGVEPSAVLYIGNDMLHDICPASQVGFRTALFAGDARSLRRRHGDPRVNGVVPDAVLTELAELRTCFPRS